MTTRDYSIEISRDLASIEAEWAALEGEGASTPFQTLAWLKPLYRYFAPGMKASPLFVLVRGQHSGKLQMLLPLCVIPRYGVDFIEFADFGVSDYNAPVLAAEFDPSPAEWLRLWRQIGQRLTMGTTLHLKKMPKLIAGRANPLAMIDDCREMPIGTWGVALPATMDEYKQKAFSEKFRQEMGRKARKLARAGAVEYFVAENPAQRREIFAVLARQRQARCDEMGRVNGLTNPYNLRFREAMNEEMSSPVHLGALKVEGRIIATALTLRYRKSSFGIMFSYDGGDWRTYSLGNLLIIRTVENSIADGIGYFDFLIGDEAYKAGFGMVRQPLYEAVIPLSRFGALVSFALGKAVALKRSRERAAAKEVELSA